MKRFILVNSPLSKEPIMVNENYLAPLGLGYIATYLNEAGINVKVVDCIKEKFRAASPGYLCQNVH